MKNICFFVLLGFSISMANSQNLVSKRDLNGGIWLPLSPVWYGVSELVSFDLSSYTTQYRYEMLQKFGQSTFPYYVSDEVPTRFDSAKIGNNNVGQYIVFYNNKLDEFDYYSVVKYVDDTLRLFHKLKPDRVGGQDLEFVYVRLNPACINVGDGHSYIFNEDLTLSLKCVSEQIHRSIMIPDSVLLYAKRFQVTAIADSAFADCARLMSVTIPGCAKKLGMHVFKGCPSLKTITCLATTPPETRADGTTFNGFDCSQCTLIVPKGCKSKYSAADGWKGFREIHEL